MYSFYALCTLLICQYSHLQTRATEALPRVTYSIEILLLPHVHPRASSVGRPMVKKYTFIASLSWIYSRSIVTTFC